jgi:hypothetical protein
LFYINGTGEMVEVQVTGDPTFVVGQQEVLFSGGPFVLTPGQASYDVSPDDQRFVMFSIGTVNSSAEIIWIEN